MDAAPERSGAAQTQIGVGSGRVGSGYLAGSWLRTCWVLGSLARALSM